MLCTARTKLLRHIFKSKLYLPTFRATRTNYWFLSIIDRVGAFRARRNNFIILNCQLDIPLRSNVNLRSLGNYFSCLFRIWGHTLSFYLNSSYGAILNCDRNYISWWDTDKENTNKKKYDSKFGFHEFYQLYLIPLIFVFKYDNYQLIYYNKNKLTYLYAKNFLFIIPL